MSYIYSPQDGRKMKVVFFFSGGATGLKTTYNDPDYDKQNYEVVCGLTDKPGCKGVCFAEGNDIPVIHLDYKPFTEKYKKKKDRREAYFTEVLQRLEEYNPDIVFMSGFMMLVENPLLSEYRNRLLNVHPADLSVIASLGGRKPLNIGRYKMKKCYVGGFDANAVIPFLEQGYERLYTGDDAVNMAVFFGEKEVCSSVHSAEKDADTGPILVQSKRLEVDTKKVERFIKRNALGSIGDYAHELQERMKYECDGPAIREALKLMAEGRMEIYDDHVALDGEDLPYYGYQLVA